MYWRRNCGAAFSKWREVELFQTMEMITVTEEAHNQMCEDHMARKKVIQKQNMVRSSKIVGKSQKHKFYTAWKNVTRWLKHKRVSTEELMQSKDSYSVKRLIKKWRMRTDTTKHARGAFETFRQKKAYIYSNACFREMMLKHHRDKALVCKLSNTAFKFDNRNLIAAFQMIQNYS